MKLWRHVQLMKAVLSVALMLAISHAQAFTTTVASTTSICYNDGTLTLSSSGGTAPYTYTITTGPAVPGISYPYTLPAGQSTFSNLAAGTYSGTVRDGSGATGTFSGTVGGTYTFPTMTMDTPLAPWLTPPVLTCTASGGLPPYEYAISVTGPSTGYGPYQASGTFTHLCPGTYWARVRDACGNIFTDSRHFDYHIGINIECTNFSNGILHAACVGNTPLTYTFHNANTGLSYINHDGIFSNVGAYDNVDLTIRDSCGVTGTYVQEKAVQRFITSCPFDGRIYAHVDYGDTVTMTCRNCSPAQTVTRVGWGSGPYYDTIFRNVSAGLTPDIVTTFYNSLTCGRDTAVSLFVAPAVAYMQLTTPACNSIRATVYSGAVGAAPVVDSFVLLPGHIAPSTHTTSTADFNSLPDGNYLVIAYLHPGQCPDSLTSSMMMPAMSIGCYQHMKDSTCADRWQLSVSPIIPERYSVINASGDTTAAQSAPGYFDKFFYGLTPAAPCTVISSAGCAVRLTTPALVPPVPQISYVNPCTGPPVLTYSYLSSNFCVTQLTFKLWHADTIVTDITFQHMSNPDVVTVQLPDSGLYHYAFYVTPFAFTPGLRYDSVCPLDSGSVYVVTDYRPRLTPAYVNVCDTNGTDSLHFHVAGGSAPYIVQIPGLDTLTLSGQTGVFPTHHPGTYPMIVYDYCGISRSLSLSVIDSCHGCPTAAMRVSDTLVCVGATVGLTDISAGGVVNEWQIDDQSYGTGPYVTYAPDSGLHQVLLITAAISGCDDTAMAYIRALPPMHLDIGADTVYCDAFSRTLSTGIPATAWSTGDTAALITASTPGLYIATIQSTCGVQRDSIMLLSHTVHGLQLRADSTTLCSNVADSLLLTATIDSQTARPVTISWSTGQQASSAYSAAIWAHTAGSYQVTARDGLCSATASITIVPVICDTACVGCDTSVHCHPCDTTCASCPDTTCAGCPDTACFSRIVFPDVFSPNGDGRNDSFYVPHTCPYYSFSLRIYDRWGQLVFETRDINKAWDGTYRGRPQPADTYACFVCSQAKPSDPIECREWHMTLIR